MNKRLFDLPVTVDLRVSMAKSMGMKIQAPECIPAGINPVLFECFHVFCMAERWISGSPLTHDIHQVFWRNEPHYITGRRGP